MSNTRKTKMSFSPDPADYADQIPRREAYELENPDVTFAWDGGFWVATLHEAGGGETSIKRRDLGMLLDRLDQLDQ